VHRVDVREVLGDPLREPLALDIRIVSLELVLADVLAGGVVPPNLDGGFFGGSVSSRTDRA
jgi:hypothetical protein